MFKKSLLSLTILGVFGAPTPDAHSEDLLKKALLDDSTHYIKLRYRYENVDDDAFSDDSTASTLRTSVGYKTGEVEGFSGTLEMQNVAKVGSDDYNDSLNGKTTHPTISDPNVTDVTQAYLSYGGITDTAVSVGRQVYNFDNMRFVNQNNWRQHHQTYDSVSLVNKSVSDTTATYVYVNRLNRSNGSDHPTGNREMNTHLINVKNSSLGDIGDLVGYGYLQDYDDASLAGASTKTYGGFLNGKYGVSDDLNVLYRAEYAIQSDHGDNTASFNADYHHYVIGLAGGNWSIKLAHEELSADDGASFGAPLGTGHGFNGWADKFLSTPGTGLVDQNVKVSYTVQGVGNSLDGLKLDARYHDFNSEDGDVDHGSEVNFKASKKFMDNYSASVIYANYNADTFAADTQKIWFILGANF